MEGVTSGELLYGLCGLDYVDLLPGSQGGNLQRFLAARTGEGEERIIRDLRQRIEAAHQANIAHLKTCAPQEMANIKEALVMESKTEKDRVTHQLHRMRKSFESLAMQSLLTYVSVIKEDLLNARAQLVHEKRQKEALKKQARVCRDFLLFCAHLQMETSGRLEITCLPHNSNQFARCVKAVHDNLGDSFGMLTRRRRLEPDDARILNVFKVKNLPLSQNLHDAMARAQGTKARGLFCCLPAEHVFAFSVHGLSTQSLPNGGVHAIEPTDRTFTTPWVFASATPLRPLAPELAHVHAVCGTAATMARRVGSGPLLRFSRLSSLSTVAMYSEEQREHGVFLALCRVLVQRQKTVARHLQEADVADAAREGYDAVFSSLTEEFALLQPAHVLPEFLIHVHFRGVDAESEGTEDNRGTGNGLPSMFVPSNAGQGSDGGAEMVLLGNEVFQQQRPSDGAGKKSAFDPQEAVRTKQAALLRIEGGVDEFRQSRQRLIGDLCRRLSHLNSAEP